jgi:2-polyprenyl-6-hydroxyphenyl methylase/3-demethylubiquinone-9 3-methyltransferase
MTVQGEAYYRKRLSGERLRRCYEVAPPRAQQYLDAEISHVLGRVEPGASVLELGCGYGRVLIRLAQRAPRVVGIDTSFDSLELARELLAGCEGWELAVMDAVDLGFSDETFDLVACIQNGICAFRVDPRRLLEEALRVSRPGGRVLFSTYTDAFWPHRLHWFELQANEGLLGQIDHAATARGEIVCKDGFRSGTMDDDGFVQLCAPLGIQPAIVHVDDSSVFCEISR